MIKHTSTYFNIFDSNLIIRHILNQINIVDIKLNINSQSNDIKLNKCICVGCLLFYI